MASKYTGVAVIFGFPGSVSFTGAGTFIKESGDFEQDIQVDEITDDDNELVTLTHSKESFIGTLLFTPRAATGVASTSLASAKLSLAPPAPGSQVTLSGFSEPAVPGARKINASDWVFVGGWKLAFKKNGVATYAMKIRRSPNNDISAQPTS